MHTWHDLKTAQLGGQKQKKDFQCTKNWKAIVLSFNLSCILRYCEGVYNCSKWW